MSTGYADPRTRCDRTPAWGLLRAHYAQSGQGFDVRTAFADDPQRAQRFSQQAPHLFADLSKNLIDVPTEALLMQLARECGLPAYRDAMFAGQPINNTERRAVMHWLLRNPAPALDGQAQTAINKVANELQDVHATLDAMLALAERVRADDAITDIVNIGIGGSDLGPAMAVKALDDLRPRGKRLHFVSNVDGMELGRLLHQLRPESTLFLIASKTFTTLGFWDWVGGRYSMWSAIGLPIAIAIGAQGFRELLAGAYAMDEHFRTAPLESNLPVRLGLLDVWYRNFHGFASRNVAPYSHGLQRLPAYLQQLEMESNGKSVDAQGQALPFATAPVVWGEPGTNGQHAFFQMIHQGPDVVPVEFVALREPGRDLPGQHLRLISNALAQAQALMVGQADDGGHRCFAGNRPSTFLVMDRLDPACLGALIALYEHRVFTSGAVWGINSFDQWGVELGKVLAKDIEPRLASGGAVEGLDASSAALVQMFQA